MTTPAQSAVGQTPANPFPGLRPFDATENHLFFGRDGQSDEILTSLRRNRFVAVVGTSGSGKSSLIRAGLMPMLHGGFMAQASSSWRIALFRPGSDPIGNLAHALTRKDVLRTDAYDEETSELITETTLRRGGLGLIEATRQARMPARANLLIIVDQFEELFRFKGSGTGETAEDDATFVKLLIEATQQTELPIYVVITMRSDFIGDCARFRELPETINRGLYLIPIMTRDQRREAITGPAAVAGTEIAPRLINRVLNDAGESPEQLPLLQHALMRTWAHWQSNTNGVGLIDLDGYEAIGGLGDALSRHADEAFDELPNERSREIAEKVFKALAEKGPDGREVRRPTKVAELAAIANASEAQVIAVIEAFRQPGRSFLMPPPEVPLDSQSLIDVSHESLIRGWRRLREWVESETLSAAIYRRVAETAVLYEKGVAGLWHDPDLQVALGWQNKVNPNEAWGRRYHPGFVAAMNFLAESVAARDKEVLLKERQRARELRRTRVFAAVLAVALVMASALGAWAMTQRRLANSSLEIARAEKQRAEVLKDKADLATLEAVKAKEEAELKRKEALESKGIADQKTKEAEANLIIARAAERKASDNARAAEKAAVEARKQKDIAEAAAEEARRQADIAVARNKQFRDAVEDAEKANLNDMGRISWLTNELIRLSSPRNAVRWRTLRASALTNRGRHSEAEAELTKALEVAPDYDDARMSRGYMYMLTDRVPESIADFDRVIAGDPKSSLGFLNRGLSQGIMGGYADASSSIKTAIQYFLPGTYDSLSENEVAPVILRATGHRTITANGSAFQTALHYELANVEAFRGGEDFLKFLESANQRPRSDSANLSAINWAWLHMNNRAQDYGGWVSQGAMWEGLGPGYCSEAAYAYEQFQKNYKEHPDPRYRSLAAWANQRAAALRCQIPTAALPTDDPQALALQADSSIDNRQYETAEQLLTKAITLEPTNVDLLLRRAEVRNRQRKFSESRADAEEVLRLAGDQPRALFYRALASDDSNVVEENLRKVLKDHPTNMQALDWLSKTLAEKNPGEAIELLDRATRLRPYDDGLYFRKAQLQEKAGRYAEALQSIESAITIDSYDTDYYDARASIERHSKSPMQIARNLIEGYNEVADLLLRRGETGAALNTYAKNLKLLAGISNPPGSGEMQCDMALTIHKVARLIEHQGASRDKTIEHLRFLFGDVKGLEGVLNDEVKGLSNSP